MELGKTEIPSAANKTRKNFKVSPANARIGINPNILPLFGFGINSKASPLFLEL